MSGCKTGMTVTFALQAMRPYEGVAVPESEHIEQNAEQLEAAFRWAAATQALLGPALRARLPGSQEVCWAGRPQLKAGCTANASQY